jgi:hypothetical protein
VLLPNNSPVARVLGPVGHSKGEAKQQVAVAALMALHKRGALDDHLRAAVRRVDVESCRGWRCCLNHCLTH